MVEPHNSDLLPLALDQAHLNLQEWLVQHGQPAFRANQIWRWLHVNGISDPGQMTNLPAALREQLAARFDWQPLTLAERHASKDGSLKLVLRTSRGNPVETVWMPGGAGGHCVCLSSHSGCGLGCQFCQTGYMGQLETLSPGQILAQLYLAEQTAGEQAQRIVLMGMGEPLLNLAPVRRVVEVLCDKQARAWSPRRITVSTVGLVKPLKELTRTFPPVNLALSLHFTQPEQRRQFMPKAESNLEWLADALAGYSERNGGKITLEYMLLAGLNHTEADARRLAQFAVRVSDGGGAFSNAGSTPVLVNLLTYNPIANAPAFAAVTEAQLNQFAGWLASFKIPVTVRRSRGQDIAAACGQLGYAYRPPPMT